MLAAADLQRYKWYIGTGPTFKMVIRGLIRAPVVSYARGRKTVFGTTYACNVQFVGAG